MINESVFKNFPEEVKQSVWDGLEDGDKIHYFEPNDEQRCLFFDTKNGRVYIYTVEADNTYSTLSIDPQTRNQLAKSLASG